MPGKHGFTSKAQQGKIFAMQGRGELPKGTATRMSNETSSFKKLPQYAFKGGMASSEHTDRYSGREYGMAQGGAVYRMKPDEFKARYPSEQYGGPVDMQAADGGEVDPHAVELLRRALARKGAGMAYGGTADGDEALARHPDEEYGDAVDESMMAGGEVTCPNCGHRYAHGGNIGRHMQPGFQDMDPETADREADLHLGKALLTHKHKLGV